MPATKKWPSLEDVIDIIPEHPKTINKPEILLRLSNRGERAYVPLKVLSARVQRRLHVAHNEGIILKNAEDEYWIASFKKTDTQGSAEPGPWAERVQIELLKFSEFLATTHMAQNKGHIQKEFQPEILRVLTYALNYNEERFEPKHVLRLFELWTQSISRRPK